MRANLHREIDRSIAAIARAHVSRSHLVILCSVFSTRKHTLPVVHRDESLWESRWSARAAEPITRVDLDAGQVLPINSAWERSDANRAVDIGIG